ncbi:MAG: flagellar protein FlgN [Methylovulum sp.]|nr:flagellar protein FlgN [Methylovulum sp.]
MIEKTYPITEKLILNALHLVEGLRFQLIQEVEALKNAQNAELINTIATNKKQLVVQLELFNTQCGQVLSTENLPNNQDGITEYFRRAAAASILTDELIRYWAQIQTLCSECKILNDQNGASIALLARHTDRSLHILKGKPHTSNTYGPDGSSQSELYARPLISV